MSDVCDANHIGVVGLHDASEGGLIAGGGERHGLDGLGPLRYPS